MSNSSRIEKATRDHVGATLTNDQIVELVKVSDPEWKGGVYASDAAYKREEGTGKLIPRGKTAYGDGVLEYLAENSFKVLATEQIVRRPSSKKKAAVAPAPANPIKEYATQEDAIPASIQTKIDAAAKAYGKQAEAPSANRKEAGKASQIPAAPKQKAIVGRHAAQ
jgi:hypothetical protein